MTEIEIRTLKVLAKADDHGLLVGPQYVGEHLWGAPRGHNSAPFARPAGKVLNRLRKLDLVEYVVTTHSGHSGWRITREGRRAIR